MAIIINFFTTAQLSGCFLLVEDFCDASSLFILFLTLLMRIYLNYRKNILKLNKNRKGFEEQCLHCKQF